MAIKNERTQILFLSDFLIALASLDLKVPNPSRQLLHHIVKGNPK